MADTRPTRELVTLAAERLEAAGNSPFKLEDLIAEVQRLDLARERGTISPTVQAMTVNATGGPRFPLLHVGSSAELTTATMS